LQGRRNHFLCNCKGNPRRSGKGVWGNGSEIHGKKQLASSLPEGRSIDEGKGKKKKVQGGKSRIEFTNMKGGVSPKERWETAKKKRPCLLIRHEIGEEKKFVFAAT